MTDTTKAGLILATSVAVLAISVWQFFLKPDAPPGGLKPATPDHYEQND